MKYNSGQLNSILNLLWISKTRPECRSQPLAGSLWPQPVHFILPHLSRLVRRRGSMTEVSGSTDISEIQPFESSCHSTITNFIAQFSNEFPVGIKIKLIKTYHRHMVAFINQCVVLNYMTLFDIHHIHDTLILYSSRYVKCNIYMQDTITKNINVGLSRRLQISQYECKQA